MQTVLGFYEEAEKYNVGRMEDGSGKFVGYEGVGMYVKGF